MSICVAFWLEEMAPTKVTFQLLGLLFCVVDGLSSARLALGVTTRRTYGTTSRFGLLDDAKNALVNFEATSSWMQPDGGESIPAFLNYLDVAKYSDFPWLNSQPIIVRLGLGLLIIDLIPLALDIFVIKLFLRRILGFGAESGSVGVGKNNTVLLKLDDSVVSAADACKFFEQNPEFLSEKAGKVLGKFYSDFLKGLGDTKSMSRQSPDAVMFSLVAGLGPGFETFVCLLAQKGMLRSQEAIQALDDKFGLKTDRTAEILQQGLDDLRLELRDVVLVKKLPLGALYSAQGDQDNDNNRLLFIGVKRPKTQMQDLEQAVLELYLARQLLQSAAQLPLNDDTKGKIAAVLGMTDGALEDVLLLRKAFSSSKTQSSGQVCVGSN